MSIEALMPKANNKRKIFRDYILGLVDLLDQNGFSVQTEREIEMHKDFLMDLASKNLTDNLYNVLPFYDRSNKISWLILADDDLAFVRIFANISMGQLEFSREKLLDLANELNLSKNTLLDVAVDNDNDIICEYHMPINIPNEVVLNVLKILVNEIEFILQYIARG